MYTDTRSCGDFCPIVITHSRDHGLRVWAIRNPKHRVDGAGVMLNTINDQRCFEYGHDGHSVRASPYIPVAEITR